MSKTEFTYEKPVLVRHGSVEEITQATTSGDVTDQEFDAGTPLTTILQNLS